MERGTKPYALEGHIAPHKHALFTLSDQPLKGLIWHIGRGTFPRYYQPRLVQQETQLADVDQRPLLGKICDVALLCLHK